MFSDSKVMGIHRIAILNFISYVI